MTAAENRAINNHNTNESITRDTIIRYFPNTYEESIEIISYPSYLKAESPEVLAANFKYEIDQKNDIIHIYEILGKDVDIALQAEEDLHHAVGETSYFTNTNEIDINIKNVSSGYYYITTFHGSVRIMKRIQLK